MCITAYVPANHTIPDSTLRIMYRNNPNGAGVMWVEDGKVHIRKGIFSIEDFLKVWHRIPITCPRVPHFRIATSGAISAATCHPFPVRKCVESLGYRSDVCDMAVSHNGIIPLTTPVNGMRNKYSDTMLFTAHILANISDLDNEFVQDMLTKSIGGSRMIILRGDKRPIILGNWVKEGKIWYSNTSFRAYQSFGYKTCSFPPVDEEFALTDDETRFIDEQKGDF